MKSPGRHSVIVFAIVALLFSFPALRAATEYEIGTPVSVNAGGQQVVLHQGQAVTLMGNADASGQIMIRVTLPGGSMTMAQVPVADIRVKAPVAPTTPPPTAVVATTPPPAAATIPPATVTDMPAAGTVPPAPAPAAPPAPPVTAPAPPVPPAPPVAKNTAPKPAGVDPIAMPTAPGTPDFGPNVLIIDPSNAGGLQQKLDAIGKQQESNNTSQFNNNRYAYLIKPGTYDLDIKVGFYMQVLGLGQTPDDVAVKAVHSNGYGNVTQTFWRGIENLEVTGKELYWGVSQGTMLRRVHVKGNLPLFSGGWASGGYTSDCECDGKLIPGSQQQWLSRNCNWATANGGVWNMVYVGCPGAPTKFPHDTAVDKTPVIAEKPYLYVDKGGQFAVMVPPLRKDAVGASWADPTPGPAGTSIPINQFFIAQAARDNVATINAALASGKNLILTPGIYHLQGSIMVTRPDTVVLGLGYPTLIPDTGMPAITTADVNGVKIGGILFEAGKVNSPSLLMVGTPGSTASHASDPTCIYDIFSRVGGFGPGSTDVMTVINSNDVIGDNTWLWRADHGNGAGWDQNKNKNGLVVNGQNVTYYGLAVEHTQQYQTLWNGENGRVFFYQSEIPYDVPNQGTWRSDSSKGYASYKVADNVKTHEAWGLGVYSLFNGGVCVLGSAYEVPAGAPGVKLHHLTSINLGGKAGGNSGIAHVINDTGGAAQTGSKFAQVTLNDWP